MVSSKGASIPATRATVPVEPKMSESGKDGASQVFPVGDTC